VERWAEWRVGFYCPRCGQRVEVRRRGLINAFLSGELSVNEARVRHMVAHYRHTHTDYEKEISCVKAPKRLKEGHGGEGDEERRRRLAEFVKKWVEKTPAQKLCSELEALTLLEGVAVIDLVEESLDEVKRYLGASTQRSQGARRRVESKVEKALNLVDAALKEYKAAEARRRGWPGLRLTPGYSAAHVEAEVRAARQRLKRALESLCEEIAVQRARSHFNRVARELMRQDGLLREVRPPRRFRSGLRTASAP